ncbi:NADP-dependent phosphogluconate dehydrogenase [Flavobacteriaceae bacterium]|nr:NADP-dependent phosphogluconate dehydrogenase [Flavobacteriaceae bacterium]MDB2685034.1 NADP-dependent phosphogluconate dehydrogenase [Flavobacteriaceae bacterium]MDB4256556.1 NADP-dependent phosphogluconate dehydrogenase [Flavobacteriaceae bacterium]
MIIIMGVSGSGKTSLGKQLSLLTSKPFYDADDFHTPANKNKMKSGHALTDSDRFPWLLDLATKIKEWTLSGGSILACSALKEEYRTILSKFNNNITWVVLNGSFDLLLPRLTKRKNHFFKPELLQSQLDTLELPTYGIHIDCNKSIKQMVQEVIDNIPVTTPATIGVIGLGVMGQGIALNSAECGLKTAVYNRFVKGEEQVVFDFLSTNSQFKNLQGFTNISSFINTLQRPRKVWLMIKSGFAIDDLLDEIVPLLNEEDIIIDGGNSYFKDTRRRALELEKRNIHYVGCGVSGGEVGARNGASLMFGGSKESYKNLSPFLKNISAKDSKGKPCVAYMGADGAGHFVKMVHNGIEYAEMQLLAETYAVLAHQMSYVEISSIFEEWNCGSEASYLLEITSKILQQKEGDAYVLDLILDSAGSKGTGLWSTKVALDLGEANTMMSSAVFARYLSGLKKQRMVLSDRKPTPLHTASFDIEKLKEAYGFSRMINHIQGFNLIEAASKKYNWDYNPSEIARVWTEGCIIRSSLMDNLSELLLSEKSLLKNEKILHHLSKYEPNIAQLIHHTIDQKIALDCYSSAYNFWLAICSERLPANLIQAQRDFFGAHTYQRVDSPLNEFFHTKWN